MLGIPLYLWRLLPGNPILLRVVAAASKRKRDLLARCLYPGLLIGVVLLAITGGGGTSLDELTTTSEKIFRQMSYLQLGLVALLAPIFTAGAITQEKDAQTYDILLATPLSNGQIVLGTLGSRLFFIVALLLSGIPIFAITKIFGGVAIGDVAISCTIAAATACVTGALATAIATFKVGTRRTIFGFYMVVVIYLIGGYLLDGIESLHPLLLDPNTNQLSTDRATASWLSGVHPFLALQTLFTGARLTDEATRLPPELRRWPLDWYFSHPSTFFPTFMLLLSAVLVLPSIVLLRRMAQSTTSWRTKLLGWLPIRAVQATRQPRTVWKNPIAWREGRTKASSARASVVRYSFATFGIGAAIVLVYLYASEPNPPTKFIQAGSYNPTNQTLFINGENQTYDLASPLKVTVDGTERGVDVLPGRYEVASHQIETVRSGKRITSIDLSRIGGRITPLQAHQLLLGLVIVELAVILLVVTNAAASAVTREREDGTLDLLLTTPITSRYYLWGKLIGLIVFVSPLLIVPLLSVLLFVAADLWKAGFGGGSGEWLVLPEAALLLPMVSLVVVAFATIVGMQMSLRNRTTVRAVMSSLGIVAACVAMLGWCGFAANASRLGVGASVIEALSPLGVIAAVIFPTEFGGPVWTMGNPDDIAQARLTLFCATLLTTAGYAAAVWAMYRSMVKNFDMTIRRQSR